MKEGLEEEEDGEEGSNKGDEGKSRKREGAPVRETGWKNKVVLQTETILVHQYKTLLLHIQQLCQQLRKREKGKIPNRANLSPEKKLKKEEIEKAPKDVKYVKSAYPHSFWGAEQRLVKIVRDDLSFVEKCEEFVNKVFRLDWIYNEKSHSSNNTSKNHKFFLPPNFPPQKPLLSNIFVAKQAEKKVILQLTLPPLNNTSPKLALPSPLKANLDGTPSPHKSVKSSSFSNPKSTPEKRANKGEKITKSKAACTAMEFMRSTTMKELPLSVLNKSSNSPRTTPAMSNQSFERNSHLKDERKRNFSLKVGKEDNKRSKPSLPIGLKNTNGSCASNAVVQCLFSLPVLSQFLTKENNLSNEVWNQLAQLHQRLRSSQDSPDTKELLESMNRLSTKPSLDAYEFFMQLCKCALEGEDQQLKGHVKRTFGFEMQHKFFCSDCLKETRKISPMISLILSLPQTSEAPINIDSLIHSLCQPHSMIGGACPSCKSLIQHRRSFTALPPVLVVKLDHGQTHSKTPIVNFEETLTVTDAKGTTSTFQLQAVSYHHKAGEGFLKFYHFFLHFHIFEKKATTPLAPSTVTSG